MNIRTLPSPNFDSRAGWVVDALVLHYTDTRDMQEALDLLLDSQAKVSSHYVVDVNGEVLQLVDEKNRAWHAGRSFWRGWTNLNQRSIGIEIVNTGHRYGLKPFPKVQMQAVAQLCTGILSRHVIAPRNVVAHSDIAPTRKKDPGELFDWQWLAAQGVGLWPFSSNPPRPCPPPQGGRELEQYGYDIADLSAAIAAFQRRFRPRVINGRWDGECATRLAALLEAV